MNYIIEKADLANAETDLQIRRLIKAAFKDDFLHAEGHIVRNIASNASRPSFILIAKENNEIIGCNAFIANDFFLNSKNYVGYQSCWTATHPNHQGKKVFVNIINEAKKILLQEGAGFLYGLPNDNSYPIFVKKLDFTEYDSMFSRIISMPFAGKIFTNNSYQPLLHDAVEIDEEQLYEHKKRQSPADILRVNHNNSFIWGKLEKRKKYGIEFSFFIVGGIKLSEPGSLQGLISGVFKTYKVRFIDIVSCSLNTNNGIIKKWKKASGLNGFIYYNLNMPDNIKLNLMFGSIDVF